MGGNQKAASQNVRPHHAQDTPCLVPFHSIVGSTVQGHFFTCPRLIWRIQPGGATQAQFICMSLVTAYSAKGVPILIALRKQVRPLCKAEDQSTLAPTVATAVLGATRTFKEV